MKYYFPSCNFTRLRPETSERIKAFMAARGVRVVGCCRPGHRAVSGWNDTVITVCETCSIIIGENRPAAKVISLYEFIDSLPDFPFPDYKGGRVTLQDCYRAKAKDAEKAAVRSVLRKMNVEIVELPQTEHPWFLGCQFHPEFKSRPTKAHPLFRDFIAAALEYGK